MHYGADAFSSNGLATITTKDPCYQSKIGTASHLSFTDVKLLNMMHKCGKTCAEDARCQAPCFLAKVRPLCM